jgi:hypothetical protein
MHGAATGAAAGGAAGAAAIIAQAIKASGVIVRVEPAEFLAILDLQQEPLVVTAEGGGVLFLPKKYQYLMSHKGLAFYTTSRHPLDLPPLADVVAAKKIWIPG